MRTTTAAIPPLTPVVLRIMVANFGIWFVTLLLIQWVHSGAVAIVFEHLVLHPAWGDLRAVWRGEVWQLYTYGWLHSLTSPLHVLFNLLVLWFFGPVLERQWGGRPFFVFYSLCLVGAALFTALAALVAPGLFGAPVLGASGAILGLVAAYALTWPHRTIYLWFVLPLRGIHLLWLTIGLDTLFFLTNPQGFAFATHLGGIATAALIVTGMWRPRRWNRAWRRWRRRGGARFRVVRGGSRDPWIH